jgi:hypothetical protein
MPQHIEYAWVYPATPLEVFRMATRLDHLEEKAAYLGHRGHRMLELRERDGVFRSVTQRQIDVNLPAWAMRIIGARNTITHRQLWGPPTLAGGRRWDVIIEIAGLPVRMAGRGALTPLGDSSTQCDVSLMVQCTMPLFGRRIEKLVAKETHDVMQGEHEFRLLWLERRGGVGRRPASYGR